MGTSYQVDAYRLARQAVFDAARFDLPDLGLQPSPSFSIERQDRIFVIGSCFAREIKAALTARGFSATDGDLGNQYNTFSIHQTLTWALEGSFDERVLVRLDDGRWFNGYRHPFVHHEDLHTAVEEQRHILSETAAAVRACDVAVLTLGLVEVWRDDLTQTWLNGTPPKRLISGFEQHYSVHRTTHAQNLRELMAVLGLLHGVRPTMRVMCTVSPVPLQATFFGHDVLLSNTYSKCTLRSAVTEAGESAVQQYDGLAVDYFPSFELAMLAPRQRVWRDRHPTGEPDGRHVRPDFVREVILDVFSRQYLRNQNEKVSVP